MSEGEIRTRLTVVDETGGVIENFENKVTRSMERVNSSAMDTVNNFAKVTRGLNAALIVWDRYEISQLAVENAQIRQQLAQEQLQYAIERYGTGSREVWRAQQQVEVSARSAEIALQRMYVRMTFGTLIVAPQFIKSLVEIYQWLNKGTLATIGQTLATQALTRARLAAIAVGTAGLGIPLAVGLLGAAQTIERGSNMHIYGDINVQGVQTPTDFARRVGEQTSYQQSRLFR